MYWWGTADSPTPDGRCDCERKSVPDCSRGCAPRLSTGAGVHTDPQGETRVWMARSPKPPGRKPGAVGSGRRFRRRVAERRAVPRGREAALRAGAPFPAARGGTGQGERCPAAAQKLVQNARSVSGPGPFPRRRGPKRDFFLVLQAPKGPISWLRGRFAGVRGECGEGRRPGNRPRRARSGRGPSDGGRAVPAD